jgi:bacillopeptidase F (M6 metalloprotease family)
MTTQDDPGSHILSQNITIPAASSALFTAHVYVNNSRAPDEAFATAASLDYTVEPNQQFRIDVMTTASVLTDMGAGVLSNIYKTNVGDAPVSGYTLVSADLSAFAGQTVRLRIAEVDNKGCISTGVDAVSIISAPLAAVPALVVPTLDDRNLLLLGLFLVAAAYLIQRKRKL